MERLTPEQAAKVRDTVRPMSAYLFRLVARLEKTNLSLRDPNLYRVARAAEEAIHALWVELHYQSCGHGVGRKPTAT
jgi:hypothetical protein